MLNTATVTAAGARRGGKDGKDEQEGKGNFG